jgi:predicted DsbA family dithiol-disulfide isomerase
MNRYDETAAKWHAHCAELDELTGKITQLHRKLGQAFCEQESDIADLLTMAEIAARASVEPEKGEAIFTCHHLRDMIDDFRQQWHESHKKAAA